MITRAALALSILSLAACGDDLDAAAPLLGRWEQTEPRSSYGTITFEEEGRLRMTSIVIDPFFGTYEVDGDRLSIARDSGPYVEAPFVQRGELLLLEVLHAAEPYGDFSKVWRSDLLVRGVPTTRELAFAIDHSAVATVTADGRTTTEVGTWVPQADGSVTVSLARTLGGRYRSIDGAMSIGRLLYERVADDE